MSSDDGLAEGIDSTSRGAESAIDISTKGNTLTPSTPNEIARWCPPKPDQLASLLPQYQIEKLLCSGALAAVYKGKQPGPDRAITIRLLPTEAAADEAFANRFLQEARTLAGVHHPGIAAVLDCGKTSEGHLFVVAEFVDGTDLEQLIYSRGVKSMQAAQIFEQVCEALQYAHDHGIVHRHIKPANVIVSPSGQAKLVDFDIASPLLDDSKHLTHLNVMLDAPDYIAPEHLDGAADHRADLYSLGVMIYETLTRQIPKGKFDKPSHLAQDIDPRFDAIVDKAMQAEPASRYASASEIRHALEPILKAPESKVEDSAPAPAMERPATVRITLPIAAAPSTPPPLSEEQRAETASSTLKEPRADAGGDAAQTIATERDWNEVHGSRSRWSWKLVAVLGVLLLAAIVGGFAVFRSNVEPEITVSERRIVLDVGQDAPPVAISIKGGNLKLDQANESMPQGLSVESQSDQQGTKTYVLKGKPTDEARSERVRLTAVGSNSNSASKTLEIVVNGTALEWVPSKEIQVRAGEDITESAKLVSGVSTSRTDWNPSCPGVEVTKSDEGGGTLTLAGVASEAGTYELSVTATARLGEPDTRVFKLIVEKSAGMVVASASSPTTGPGTQAAPNPGSIGASSQPLIAGVSPGAASPSGTASPSGASTTGTMAAGSPSAAAGLSPSPPVTGTTTVATQPNASSTSTPLVANVPAGLSQQPATSIMPSATAVTPNPANGSVSASPIPTVPTAPGVAILVRGSFTHVKSPYGDREIEVSPRDWDAGEVLDLTAGKTAALPRMADPKLTADVVDLVSRTVRNPYTGATEKWEERDWKPGAGRPWARGLTYHLPNILPTIRPASYVGDQKVRSPYDGTTIFVPWKELAKGGRIQDSSGRWMKLPNISDPALPAKVIDSDKQTFLNPYTDKVEQWNERKPFITGARGNWNSLSFILGEVKPSTKAIPSVPAPPANVAASSKKAVPPPPARPQSKFKGEPFSTSRSFVMKFDDRNGYWISTTPVSTTGLSDVRKLCDDLTKECRRSGKIPAGSSFEVSDGPKGKHLIVRP